MWYIIVTVSVVGFGDVYPETFLGRGISVVAVVIGNILIALMVVSLTFTSEFSPQERKAYELINQDFSHYQLNVKAIKFIQSALRYRVYMKKTLKPSALKQ